MYEKSSVNSVAALREARRRRILENSESRLKLIEGIKLTSTKASPESVGDPKTGIETKEASTTLRKSSNSDINSKVNDIITSNNELNNELKKISDFLLKDRLGTQGGKDLAEEEELVVTSNNGLKEISNYLLRDQLKTQGDEDLSGEEESAVEGVNVQEKRKTLYFELLLQKRLHYVILALTVDILLFFNVGYLFYENIFCPFYTLKTIELISRGIEKEDIQPVFLLFSACLPQRVQQFIKIFFTISLALIPDLCIYLFTFIIGAKIMNLED